MSASDRLLEVNKAIAALYEKLEKIDTTADTPNREWQDVFTAIGQLTREYCRLTGTEHE